MSGHILYAVYYCLVARTNEDFDAGTWIGMLMLLSAAGIITYIATMQTKK